MDVICADEQPIQVFQNFARNHSTRCDDVDPLPPLSLRNVEDLLHERGIYNIHDKNPVLVAPFRFDVRGRDPQIAASKDAGLAEWRQLAACDGVSSGLSATS